MTDFSDLYAFLYIAFGLLGQIDACFRQANAIVAPFKESYAQAAFQVIDLLNDGAGADVKRIGGSGEIAGLRHFQKCLQLFVVHIKYPPVRLGYKFCLILSIIYSVWKCKLFYGIM